MPRTVYVTVALTADDYVTDDDIARYVSDSLNRIEGGLRGMDPRIVSTQSEV